jgi:BRCA1-associated protein
MDEKIPALERERERAARRADKFEGMARKLEREWREEKAMGGSLLEKVKGLGDEVQALRAEKKELEEQNRDLSFFISGGEKLKAVAGAMGEEIREGKVSVPDGEPEGKGRKKGGKGKR